MQMICDNGQRDELDAPPYSRTSLRSADSDANLSWRAKQALHLACKGRICRHGAGYAGYAG
jgi:hypothetical protein